MQSQQHLHEPALRTVRRTRSALGNALRSPGKCSTTRCVLLEWYQYLSLEVMDWTAQVLTSAIRDFLPYRFGDASRGAMLCYRHVNVLPSPKSTWARECMYL
jgi:hypothetical protein